jgi:hypothetical protein
VNSDPFCHGKSVIGCGALSAQIAVKTSACRCAWKSTRIFAIFGQNGGFESFCGLQVVDSRWMGEEQIADSGVFGKLRDHLNAFFISGLHAVGVRACRKKRVILANVVNDGLKADFSAIPTGEGLRVSLVLLGEDRSDGMEGIGIVFRGSR